MTKKTPVILQLSDTECGVASLAMLFAFYNLNIPLEELRDKCGASRDGCKASTLTSVASSYGFKAEAYAVDIETVSKLTEPVIAHWGFSHYVVINRVDKNFAHINDPAFGSVTVPMSEFDRLFAGIIIDIQPEKAIQKKKVQHNIYLKKLNFRNELPFIFICVLISSISFFLSSSLYALFIDQCIRSKNTDLSIKLLLALTTVFIIFALSNLLHKLTNFKLIAKISLSHTSHITKHILQLQMIYFSLRQKEEIITVAAKIESIINLHVKATLNLLNAFVMSIISLTCMASIDLIMTLSSLAISIIYSFLLSNINQLTSSQEKSTINLSARQYTNLLSAMQNIETIKACALEENIIKKWRFLFSKKMSSQSKITALSSLSSTLMKSYNMISMFIILFVGSCQICNANLSTGKLMAYYGLQLVFYNYLNEFLSAVSTIKNCRAQQDRINDIALYDIDKRFIIEPTKDDKRKHETAISCANVGFAYNIHSSPTLMNINLEIRKNQHVAFVGYTGSGKSTLGKLLCALYRPSNGEIRLFDKAITEYSASELADNCAYVSQHINLFSGSLYQNLVFGNEIVSSEHLLKIINIACLDSLIAERGLYAQVEEDGKNFSGGEKQRIDIARALLQDTPILILDEATSALDNKTESELIMNLRNINKTIIFISHRLKSIKHCDRIFVFKDGKIIEQGNYSSLPQMKEFHSLISNEKYQ